MDHVPELVRECLAGGLSSSIATSILNPMDVTKTRLQTQAQLAGKPLSFIQTFANIYRSGGIMGLWGPGLVPTILREMKYSSARIGFYPMVRDIISDGQESSSLGTKVAAALTTGTIASIFANPADVVKIRLMADPKRYTSTFSAFREIRRAEGFQAGLMRGMIPSTARGGAIAVGEIATYDHTKESLKDFIGLEEGFALHCTSAMITGFVATTVAAPFDIIKTRYMNDTASTGTRLYTGTVRNNTPGQVVCH